MCTQPARQFSHALPPTHLTRTTGAIEKLADLKLKGPAVELLLALSEAVGPQFVAVQLHKKAAAHKNPKVRARCYLVWDSWHVPVSVHAKWSAGRYPCVPTDLGGGGAVVLALCAAPKRLCC